MATIINSRAITSMVVRDTEPRSVYKGLIAHVSSPYWHSVVGMGMVIHRKAVRN